MRARSSSMSSSVGNIAAAMRTESDPVALEPIGDHRIIIHLTATMRSRCIETGKEHLRRAGDIDLIPSGTAAGFVAETPYRSLQIRLAPGMLDHAASRAGRLTSVRLGTHHMLRNDRIVLLGQALESDIKAGSPSGPLFAENVGMALAVELLGLADDAPRDITRLSDAQLQRIAVYVDENLDQPLTVDTLCREAGVSSSHLRTWFKAAMGVTVHRYVLQRRLEHARQLLLQGDRKLSDIALEAGFSHQSHLAKWMRREFGRSPAELRRSRT
ncbi:AraC family transcriptional regulator [Bradyrhizobium sp. BR 10289]|uniref:helix-turn-helix transcriptional regulator n=1 Tax=Bradyrhizobium sp. BR 10289 TaxID=2749993 RepID=UPI001C64AAD9|nr:AraC family transcriptional regulator [Bradyrhizobium sp. BR 10289]MBW7973358.1 helix-turn-helix transcriptional regulator [Bradyrhizobium sp. BR 10289]